MTRVGQLSGANALRFYAASSIVLFHLIHLTKMDYPSALSFIPNYGGLGVPLFYVLSAFVLCIGYHSKLGNSEEIRKFYVRRFFRIAPLFYLLIVFYVIFLWAAFGQQIGIMRIVTSLTFTFNLVPGHSTGFVWASWSIGVEMLFYAIFPLVLMYSGTLKRSFIAFVLSILLAAAWQSAFFEAKGDFASFGNYSLIGHFPYFSAGVFSYHVWTKLVRTDLFHKFTTCAAVVAIVVLVLASPKLLQFVGQIFGPEYVKAGHSTMWAIVLAVLVVGMGFERFQTRFLNLTAILGEASYSIYLLHPLLIVGFNMLGVYRFVGDVFPGPAMSFAASAILTFAALIPVSLLSYHWIEKGLGVAAREYFTTRTVVAEPHTNQSMS